VISAALANRSAVQYAQWWLRKERHYVSDLTSADRARQLSGLKAAAGYFRVARNFPLTYDTGRGLGRLAPVLDLLNHEGLKGVTDDTLAEAVQFLRTTLGSAYGGRDLLSAATKFLWLRHKDAVIIFDSQARAALKSPPGDYVVYLQSWRTQYAEAIPRISQACRSTQVHVTLGPQHADAKAEWFRRRVFDIVLWNVGSKARPAGS
jgi:hypothetical protein